MTVSEHQNEMRRWIQARMEADARSAARAAVLAEMVEMSHQWVRSCISQRGLFKWWKIRRAKRQWAERWGGTFWRLFISLEYDLRAAEQAIPQITYRGPELFHSPVDFVARVTGYGAQYREPLKFQLTAQFHDAQWTQSVVVAPDTPFEHMKGGMFRFETLAAAIGAKFILQNTYGGLPDALKSAMEALVKKEQSEETPDGSSIHPSTIH